MIKVVHIITGLDTGGAEMMLLKLLAHHNRAAFCMEVISLTNIGPVGTKIQKLGIKVRELGMRRGMPNFLSLFRLARWLKKDKPDVVQTWMYHADLAGGLAARMAGIPNVAWNIRHTTLDPETSNWLTFLTVRLCAWFSRYLPRRIVNCAHMGEKVHTELGYVREKMVVIPNGFNLEVYHPNPKARHDVRCELGLPEDAMLIGLVGRFHPQKDHGTFIRAAGLIRQQRRDVHFVMCGLDVTPENPKLLEWMTEAGVQDQCHLLGKRDDIPCLTAAFDLAALSSAFGEGFPNVIGEAMACGIPAVVTDVGDSAFLVQDTGRVVPVKDANAFAEACLELLALEPEQRKALGQRARCRIEENFTLSGTVEKYQALYQELAGICVESPAF